MSIIILSANRKGHFANYQLVNSINTGYLYKYFNKDSIHFLEFRDELLYRFDFNKNSSNIKDIDVVINNFISDYESARKSGISLHFVDVENKYEMLIDEFKNECHWIPVTMNYFHHL